MKELIENLFESLETGKRKLNEQQRKFLKEKYNYYGSFNYASDDWGSLIIECNDDTFKNIEHYLGLEYERDNQEIIIKTHIKVIVSYNGSERISQLLEQLEALEEVVEA